VRLLVDKVILQNARCNNEVNEVRHVCMLYNATAILCLQYTVHVMLFPTKNVSYLYIITFRNLCTVSVVAVFCSSLTSCFPGVLFR